MQNRSGIRFLCRNLNEIIVRHIKKSLPLLRSKITSLLYQKEKELRTIEVCKDQPTQQLVILNVIAKYSKMYEEYQEYIQPHVRL